MQHAWSASTLQHTKRSKRPGVSEYGTVFLAFLKAWPDEFTMKNTTVWWDDADGCYYVPILNMNHFLFLFLNLVSSLRLTKRSPNLTQPHNVGWNFFSYKIFLIHCLWDEVYVMMASIYTLSEMLWRLECVMVKFKLKLSHNQQGVENDIKWANIRVPHQVESNQLQANFQRTHNCHRWSKTN